MSNLTTVSRITEFGRVRLSKSFFMRDFLYSEIAAVHGLNNAPDDPDLAIKAGKSLCEELLEPLQAHWGRIAVRSSYRSREVNQFGWELQRAGKKDYNCASNDKNAARHIWDMLDAGAMGATACIVVPAFWDAHQQPDGWRVMADWVDTNLHYSELQFFLSTGHSISIGTKNRSGSLKAISSNLRQFDEYKASIRKYQVKSETLIIETFTSACDITSFAIRKKSGLPEASVPSMLSIPVNAYLPSSPKIVVISVLCRMASALTRQVELPA